MDTTFLKNLNVLYVEDDSFIRKELKESFELVFNNVCVCSNGQKALEKYKEHKNSIDVIVSDINMPVLNGIELLNEIRKYDEDIPFIFTTAHTNQEYLIQGIKLHVDDYFIKPVKINELFYKIIKLVRKRKNENKSNHYHEIINDYLETINKIAVVYVFDSNKKITYLNDFYKEMSKFDNDEILHCDFSFLYHKDISKSLIDKQWKDLILGRKWNGNLKFKTKDDSAFYTNCSIVPIRDDYENKYISINFIITKEENERREFKKKVLYNFQETKKINKIAKNKIDFLSYELESYKNYDKKSEELDNIKELNKNYLKNIEKLEIKLKEIRNRQEKFTNEVNTKVKQISESTSKMREFTRKSDKLIVSLEKEVKIRENYISKIKEELTLKKQKVIDLEDVLKHRDSQLEDLLMKDDNSNSIFEDILAKD